MDGAIDFSDNTFLVQFKVSSMFKRHTDLLLDEFLLKTVSWHARFLQQETHVLEQSHFLKSTSTLAAKAKTKAAHGRLEAAMDQLKQYSEEIASAKKEEVQSWLDNGPKLVGQRCLWFGGQAKNC
eukprot:1868274-Amphidinium_carterae.1